MGRGGGGRLVRKCEYLRTGRVKSTLRFAQQKVFLKDLRGPAPGFGLHSLASQNKLFAATAVWKCEDIVHTAKSDGCS